MSSLCIFVFKTDFSLVNVQVTCESQFIAIDPPLKFLCLKSTLRA